MWQELQRDLEVELGVLGKVNFAHAARTEFFEDFVMGDNFANHLIVLLRKVRLALSGNIICPNPHWHRASLSSDFHVNMFETNVLQ